MFILVQHLNKKDRIAYMDETENAHIKRTEFSEI